MMEAAGPGRGQDNTGIRAARIQIGVGCGGVSVFSGVPWAHFELTEAPVLAPSSALSRSSLSKGFDTSHAH